MEDTVMTLNYACKPSGLYIMSKSDFDPLAYRILEEKQPCVLEKAMPLDLEDLAENAFPLTCYDAILSKNGSILGLISFSDQNVPIFNDDFDECSIPAPEGTIIIDKRLRTVPTRYRFTKAHEISHWILHRRFYSAYNKPLNFRSSGSSYIANRTEAAGRKNPVAAKTDFEWSEWQSDCLSAAMLMPACTFVPTAQKLIAAHGHANGKLSRDSVDSKRIQGEIASIYEVSRRSVEIRLSTYGFFD